MGPISTIMGDLMGTLDNDVSLLPFARSIDRSIGRSGGNRIPPDARGKAGAGGRGRGGRGRWRGPRRRRRGLRRRPSPPPLPRSSPVAGPPDGPGPAAAVRAPTRRAQRRGALGDEAGPREGAGLAARREPKGPGAPSRPSRGRRRGGLVATSCAPSVYLGKRHPSLSRPRPRTPRERHHCGPDGPRGTTTDGERQRRVPVGPLPSPPATTTSGLPGAPPPF